MSELFLALLRMSLLSCYVILFVITIRWLLKKSPKLISYALWGVVAFRLIIPSSLTSIFSLIPSRTYHAVMPNQIIQLDSAQMNHGVDLVDSFANQVLVAQSGPIHLFQDYLRIGTFIWFTGMVLLLLYSFISILRIKKQLKGAQLIHDNVYKAHNLKTPFVLGLINPKIYLPSGLQETEKSYILLHEQTHIRRKDHVVKALAFVILSIHWFNPLVWLSFVLMSKDMELSCDECVLKQIQGNIKQSYASSLLSLVTEKRTINSSPLAFGEGNIEERIKNVLNYKKPKLWIVVISCAIAVFIAIGLISNPALANGASEHSEIYSVADTWAQALKSRDGKVRYQLIRPEMKDDYYQSLVSLYGEEHPWTIGVSSPYVVDYDIKENQTNAVITYTTATSDGQTYVYQEQLSFETDAQNTYVSTSVVTVSYLREDLYKQAIEIQRQVDDGHQTWRLSPESLTKQFVHNDLGIQGGEIVKISSNDVTFKKDDGEIIKIELYKPLNIEGGFLAVYRYAIGTTHYTLDNLIAPQ